MDVTGMGSYLQTQYTNNMNSNAAANATKSASGISSESSKEEVEKAVKSFESYFVEQVIKEVKKSFVPEDDNEDGTMSMYKDYFMDSAISQIASELVDEVGSGITDDFVKSIMLNYGIEDEDAENAADDAETTETVAGDDSVK